MILFPTVFIMVLLLFSDMTFQSLRCKNWWVRSGPSNDFCVDLALVLKLSFQTRVFMETWTIGINKVHQAGIVDFRHRISLGGFQLLFYYSEIYVFREVSPSWVCGFLYVIYNLGFYSFWSHFIFPSWSRANY